jgi:asparagine synthase (glutamine-hydrolysing)
MCGIFGILCHNGETVPDERCLTETARLLSHRGPDSQGVYSEAGIGLAHTRLSLLDLNSRSDQPFWDREGRYCLVYNGEVYNFKELREELELTGTGFRTTSDTEVLLEWLIKRGAEATLPRLEGMFAFALYDRTERSLLLARDRFGIKPLFVHDGEDAFVFSSEVLGMKPWLKLEPDDFSISAFLFGNPAYGFGGPTKEHSFFKGIRILPPGCVVKVRTGMPAQYGKFFSGVDFLNEDLSERLQRLRPMQLVNETEELLFASVKTQMVADARVGGLCSGGVDSSVIMAMAARCHNNLAVFHANVVGPLSEYSAAAALARHLRLDLKAIEVSDQDFIDILPEAVRHFGHPCYHMPHSVPFLQVSKLVRDTGVKAVLSGEGSDECFLGYSFLSPDLRQWKRYAKDFLKMLIRKIEGGRDSQQYEWQTYPSRNVALSYEAVIRGLHTRFEMALETEDIFDAVRRRNGTISYNSIKSLDLLNYNLRALLHRNDSMGMAASVESRFPFLDSRLVRYAVNMPYNAKIRFSPAARDRNHSFFQDKWVLRKLADRYLPKTLARLPKEPFPVNAFQRMQIASAFFDKSFIVDLFGLSSREIRYLIDRSEQHLKLKLLHLDVWAHLCLRGVPAQTYVERLREHVVVKPVA